MARLAARVRKVWPISDTLTSLTPTLTSQPLFIEHGTAESARKARLEPCAYSARGNREGFPKL